MRARFIRAWPIALSLVPLLGLGSVGACSVFTSTGDDSSGDDSTDASRAGDGNGVDSGTSDGSSVTDGSGLDGTAQDLDGDAGCAIPLVASSVLDGCETEGGTVCTFTGRCTTSIAECMPATAGISCVTNASCAGEPCCAAIGFANSGSCPYGGTLTGSVECYAALSCAAGTYRVCSEAEPCPSGFNCVPVHIDATGGLPAFDIDLCQAGSGGN